ncbi:MAG: hypothetical protein GX326_04430 [Clostridiaceae bacterium]|nr:hypothetical protein [Clostridiaceae bacterium]
MEYWEGFFLGKYWTDSDYNDRKHPTLFIGIAIFVFALFIAEIIAPEKVSFIFELPVYINFAIGIVLLIGLPFFAMNYFRFNIILRVIILFLYFFQYLFLFIGFIQVLTQNIQIDFAEMPTYLLDFFDSLLIISSDVFKFLGSLASAIASVAFGIIIGGILGLLIIIACICLPLIYLIVFRQLQRLLDYILYRRKFSELGSKT